MTSSIHRDVYFLYLPYTRDIICQACDNHLKYQRDKLAYRLHKIIKIKVYSILI